MEQKIETGGPAFPAPDLGEHDFGQRGAYWGMTLRDYFAAKAMQAFIRGANNVMFGVSYPDNNMNYALVAYAMADAMIKAREVKNGQD